MRPIMLQGHTRPLTQIKYNREGDLLFTVAKDNTVNCWYSHNGERLGTYEGHVGSLWTVDANSSSTRLVTGSADNTARLWDIRTGKLLHTWEFKTAVKRVQWSEDDKYVLMVTERRMGYPGTIIVMRVDQDTDVPNSQTTEFTSEITPEGSKATVAGWTYLNKHIVTGHEDGTVSLYDWKTGEQVASTKQHDAVVTDIQFSADRTYFITSAKDKTAVIYETSSLHPLKVYTTDTPLNSASITPIQDFVVLGGGQEAMNVTTTGARQGKFECRFHHKILLEECGRVRGHFGPINTIAVHPDGKSFASGGEDGFIRVHHYDDDFFRFRVA
ncbi:MAG: WD40-repeat-containing domain protein [Piptocephalis tieghemiana]|nr:MAG: WD40-repeat-containing domain protein [Piptocephalis tieghemiana]